MKIRRVVSGHSADGKAIVASDEHVDPIRLNLSPGYEFHRLWGADETPTFPDDGGPRPAVTYYPSDGGHRFGLFTIPPETLFSPSDIDVPAALAAMEDSLPGMASRMERDAPGMHKTDTIDYQYVVSGEVDLEFDDGDVVHLSAGDTVVQNGTRHAWNNRSSEPCQLLVVFIGAKRAG